MRSVIRRVSVMGFELTEIYALEKFKEVLIIPLNLKSPEGSRRTEYVILKDFYQNEKYAVILTHIFQSKFVSVKILKKI